MQRQPQPTIEEYAARLRAAKAAAPPRVMPDPDAVRKKFPHLFDPDYERRCHARVEVVEGCDEGEAVLDAKSKRKRVRRPSSASRQATNMGRRASKRRSEVSRSRSRPMAQRPIGRRQRSRRPIRSKPRPTCGG